MRKRKLLFSVNQFFKGGAETALLNLFRALSPEAYEIDFLIFDQLDLKGSLSLIPQIPDWINVIHVGAREKWFAYVKKAYFRVYRDLTQKQLFRRSVHRYLKGRRYDAAISFGEWFSCAPIATMVIAARKYVWIHADMDKAAFLHPDILSYQQYFDQFIFVSEHSRQGALERYPFLRERSTVIHNLVDVEELAEKSRETYTPPIPDDGLPVLLTVANVRPEKNHLRQIQAMVLLRDRGIHFHWLNIGSLADREQVGQVERAVRETGLEGYFHLLGSSENPYPCMRAADAVCVLSDHESWSMVITEAKALGVPVIATRTSGALEQLVHGESGVLCSFTAEDIAEKIENFLNDPAEGEHIRRALRSFSPRGDVLPEVEALLQNNRKKVLYVFDDANYRSGARQAALAQMDVLRDSAELSLFSAEPCLDDAVSQQYRVIDLESNRAFRSLSIPFRSVLRGREFSWRIKLLRCAYAVSARLHLDHIIYNFLLGRELTCFLRGYDVICVVSEASKLRAFVYKLDGPRKIQWIHTDYAAWREYSPWTRAITKHDGEIYRRYDTVVLLSPRLRERFAAVYPHLAEKTAVIPNFIDYEAITRGAHAPCPITVDKETYNLITIGRMEAEKRFDRLLEVAAELQRRGFDFHWYFVGGGGLFPEIQARRDRMGLSERVTLTGTMENPYPLMAQCDLFVLLSDYEGTPVTIDEAKVLGLPVLAGDVGGIADQLCGERYGRLTAAAPEQAADDVIKLPSVFTFYTEKDCFRCNAIARRELTTFIGM